MGPDAQNTYKCVGGMSDVKGYALYEQHRDPVPSPRVLCYRVGRELAVLLKLEPSMLVR